MVLLSYNYWSSSIICFFNYERWCYKYLQLWIFLLSFISFQSYQYEVLLPTTMGLLYYLIFLFPSVWCYYLQLMVFEHHLFIDYCWYYDQQLLVSLLSCLIPILIYGNITQNYCSSILIHFRFASIDRLPSCLLIYSLMYGVSTYQT